MKNTRGVVIGTAAIVFTAIFFVVPFIFIFVMASKDKVESALLKFLVGGLAPRPYNRGRLRQLAAKEKAGR